MIKNIALVIVGLWLFKKLGHAHASATISAEIAPVDPYGSITNQWEQMQGYGLGDYGPYGPNAHAPGFHQVIGQEPMTANPCVCR
ncbi:hypothetical protein [Dechloromonas sp. HYN0024]|uniref:hypothetical protein n=1 Tax=Dechloromonas sp. HYN0024 TaxID=2231055 RepID=UPI000E44BB8A|nr:hypothetical protein [Dechloromonas sp. HYN0024]AXS79854.1 hypothetical protein HYN24_07390 [Dechloromonas sp. HYN0024]